MLSLGEHQRYVIDLLQPVAAMPLRHSLLRSATTDSLSVPHTRLLFNERAFRVVAPRCGSNCLATSVVSTILTLLRKKIKDY